MSRTRTNQEWRQELASSGELQNAAIEDLRAVLLRASLYTFQRISGDLAGFTPGEIRELAEDCAQEALIAILERLPEFRGESKFTTWAYKFAINISLTAARRQRWKGVSLDELLDQGSESGWAFFDHPAPDLDLSPARAEVKEIIAEVIHSELTEKQRAVLKWIVFDEVPMDVVVEHLNTNRNAVYKLLHDARRKLKQRLQSRGLDVDETLDLFST